MVLFRVFHSCWNIVMNASNEWTIYYKICQRGNKTLATKTSLKFKKIKALLLSQYCTMKFNLLEIRALSYNTVGFAILLWNMSTHFLSPSSPDVSPIVYIHISMWICVYLQYVSSVKTMWFHSKFQMALLARHVLFSHFWNMVVHMLWWWWLTKYYRQFYNRQK